MKNRINRTSFYIAIAALVLLIVNITLGFFLTMESSRAMKDLIKSRMLDISNTAAAMLDGDALRDIQAEDVDTPEYQKILQTLTYYQDNIDLKYIYCIRDMGNRKFVFTIDPTTEDPGVFGEPIVYTDALYDASTGKASVDDAPYEDKWGRFYSSYSPVFDSEGKVAGIVAVDFSADWYERQISNQIMTVFIISMLSLVFGIVIIFMIATSARKRVRSLYRELNDLSNGIEELTNELSSEGETLKGTELLHTDLREENDEVTLVGEKIRSLRKYLGVQIDYVRSKAYKDALTGLENRNAYLEFVNQIDDRIRNEEGVSFIVAMFDVNGLKEINDQKGHESGDQLIRTAANLLKRSFTKEKIFRIGGDEFVVIIDDPGTDTDLLFENYERLVAEDEAKEGHSRIMSKGYARYDRALDKKYEDTFRRADSLMYENKKTYYETLGNRRSR